jgi:hypothetical protein
VVHGVGHEQIAGGVDGHVGGGCQQAVPEAAVATAGEDRRDGPLRVDLDDPVVAGVGDVEGPGAVDGDPLGATVVTIPSRPTRRTRWLPVSAT